MRTTFLAVLVVSPALFAASQDRSVPAFNAVHISSGMRAKIEIGPRRPIHLEASEELLSQLETVVEDGQLRIQFKRDMVRWHEGDEVRITIQTPELRALGASGGAIVDATFTRSDRSRIEASGGSELHVRGVDAAGLKIHASGGSVVDVEGNADSLDAQLSGGSHLVGKELAVRELEVEGSGGSVGEIRASDVVRGALSGGSRIHVRGRPRTKVVSSGGSGVDVDG
jgi:hypothetical protein